MFKDKGTLEKGYLPKYRLKRKYLLFKFLNKMKLNIYVDIDQFSVSMTHSHKDSTILRSLWQVQQSTFTSVPRDDFRTYRTELSAWKVWVGNCSY